MKLRLLQQAEAAERLAHVVSYGPDKDRLREQAARLRRQAEEPVDAEAREPNARRPL